MITQRDEKTIDKSIYVSRDLSWLKFNFRVFDQAKNSSRVIFDRLKFMAIASSNLDEFFMIRVGSLYNYIDFNRDRIDYSGLNAHQFRKKLLIDINQFVQELNHYYLSDLQPEFEKNGFKIVNINEIKDEHREMVFKYFTKAIFPMLTPMLYDNTHAFPMLMNKVLSFAVLTKDGKGVKEETKLTFVQVPTNLPRFYEIATPEKILFLPIEEIIRWQIQKMFRNVEIESVSLLRITRNGDFTEDVEDTDTNFLEEMKKKLNTRKTARVVRVEIEPNASKLLINTLLDKFELDEFNLFENKGLIDFTGLGQIMRHEEFRSKIPSLPKPVPPLSYENTEHENLFEYLKHKDLLMHLPYNSMEPLVQLVEMAANDPGVLAIKITIYRLAKESRIANALLKAANNGKHVSVLFEVKARFDEEQNMSEAEKLQKAGCFVIYGVGKYKTHTKLMLIVRQEEGHRITRYVHISSGNYNEITSKFYTDLGLLSTNEAYANDVSEFFNVITGHSNPENYQYLITAPHNMRKQLIQLIRNEVENAKKGLVAGIVWKVNSLQDNDIMDEIYKASEAGVTVKLIVRGICCIRPGRAGLSSNIEVYSIVGDYLEHARVYYFHNNGNSLVYSGSADAMVRSFDRRIESLYLIVDEKVKKEVINILAYNLKDNVNAYKMKEDGNYIKVSNQLPPFNVHSEFYKVKPEDFTDLLQYFSKKEKAKKQNTVEASV
ncbi:MAG: polyphosphate kinase 1 [Bacteroidota bacterium]|nr:polyphosphate kinase 1 [Bacteroidota bacterium]